MKINTKNKLLLIGFFISLYFSYSLAISKTLFYKNQYQASQEIANDTNNPQLLAQLHYKEKQIDKWMAQNSSTMSNFQNELLKQLNLYCNEQQLKIVDFQEPHKYIENQSQTLSYSFSLEGSFNGVIVVLNKIENQQNLGQIKHISSQKKTNYKTNQDYLITTVIIEKIENLKK